MAYPPCHKKVDIRSLMCQVQISMRGTVTHLQKTCPLSGFHQLKNVHLLRSGSFAPARFSDFHLAEKISNVSDLDNNHRHVGHGTLGTAREGQELAQRTTPDLPRGNSSSRGTGTNPKKTCPLSGIPPPAEEQFGCAV